MEIKLKGISEAISTYRLNEYQSNQLALSVVKTVSEYIYHRWMELAAKELGSTREQYMRGLQQVDIEINGRMIKGIIALTGQLPNMIENGCPSFDMKTGFAGNPNGKMKTKKNGGWYTTIPMRFATPGALGENEAFANKVSTNVFKIAKDLNPFSVSIGDFKPLRQTGYGKITKADIGDAYKNIKTKGYGVYDSYEHKSDISLGMVKSKSIGSKSVTSKYMTFRRVSDTSDPNSWIHPGFRPMNFAERAVNSEDIGVKTMNAIAKYLTNIGF